MVITDANIKNAKGAVVAKEREMKEHSDKMEAMKVRGSKFIVALANVKLF